mgnify:CR=1 FL=1
MLSFFLPSAQFFPKIRPFSGLFCPGGCCSAEIHLVVAGYCPILSGSVGYLPTFFSPLDLEVYQ